MDPNARLYNDLAEAERRSLGIMDRPKRHGRHVSHEQPTTDQRSAEIHFENGDCAWPALGRCPVEVLVPRHRRPGPALGPDTLGGAA
jgi:hypothetical protein